MTSRFKKATRTQSRARIALVGPSGSGKTFTALILARGLAGENGRVALIDTERSSASKYAGSVAEFDALDLEHHDPREYVQAIKDAAAEKYEVLVIDSLSHAWSGRGGALELVDKAAARSKSGNSFMAWRDVTPLHNQLVDAILAYPGHVIVTMRAKTEYVLEEGPGGRKTPRKIGLAPVQRDGMEYEFDVVGDIDHDHQLVITKSRCPELADAVIPRPGRELAETLRAWLEDGAPIPAPAAPRTGESKSGAKAQRVGGSESVSEKATSQLERVTDKESLRRWLGAWAPTLTKLPDGEKKALWRATVDRAGAVGIDEVEAKALRDELFAQLKAKKEKAS